MSSKHEKEEFAMYDDGELPDLANIPDPTLGGRGRVRLGIVREPAADMELELIPCKYPSATAAVIRRLIPADEPQEIVGALLLDSRHRPIGYTLPYRGTLSKAILEARGIFVPALLRNAAAIIVFHNHPSGDPTPSDEDKEQTKNLIRAGRILGVRVLDHLVLGEGRGYVSFRELGIWDHLERSA